MSANERVLKHPVRHSYVDDLPDRLAGQMGKPVKQKCYDNHSENERKGINKTKNIAVHMKSPAPR